MQSAIRLVKGSDGFATLFLNRPTVHNALSDLVINEIRETLQVVRQAPPRALFLRGEGKSFCAGADLEWMKRAASYTREENEKDAMNLSSMLNELGELPCPTVALVQGAAMGGGVGIVSCCDVAIGVKKAIFSLSEVKLGLIPATIGPYVLRRIGEGHSRRLFVTAERISADQAKSVGLLHEVVEDDAELDNAEKRLKAEFSKNSPVAMTASKSLIKAIAGKTIDESLMRLTAQRLASQRDTVQCKEGIQAFFEKRPADFVINK